MYTNYSRYIHAFIRRSYIYGKRKTRKAIAIKIKTENLQDANLKKNRCFLRNIPTK